MHYIRELVKYRAMTGQLVRRDLCVRYRKSAFGFLWTFFNPLFQLVIYSMVFSVILKSGREAYALFLFSALVPWLFFSSSLTAGCTSILAMQDLVRKVYFPRMVLPISCVTGQLVHLLLSLPVVLAACWIGERPVRLCALVWLPVLIVVEYLLALGLACILACVTVYLRDVEQFTSLALMGWQFLTPVMYDAQQVPEELRWIFRLNPMTPVITGFREVMFYGREPCVESLIWPLGVGMVLVTLGIWMFYRLEGGMVENL